VNVFHTASKRISMGEIFTQVIKTSWIWKKGELVSKQVDCSVLDGICDGAPNKFKRFLKLSPMNIHT
jgi:hypothetical protein